MPLGRRRSGRQKTPASWECDNKRIMFKLCICLALTSFQSPFIIISNWKEPKWPTIGDRLNKQWSINWMEYFINGDNGELAD